MRLKYLLSALFLVLTSGLFYIAASERNYVVYTDTDTSTSAATVTSQAKTTGERRMVDMIADDSYLIEKGDSTIFILVGNFAAHHNGTVILADSAVRYSNQSFECFGNVLINQNDTYAYGNRASYNRISSTATLYDDLIKVVDGEAVMYTYNCSFDTANEVGRFTGGCYVKKGESLMESDRGYYYTDRHELIAVDNVEMRDDTYLMTGDSVIFNTQTEDARYYSNTNIWNDKDEYLFANEGSYTKSRDLHHLTRDAYILSPEREIWSDSIEYYRTDGHIVGRSNIQVDDTTQKVLGFADYGEWWDEPGNALFTRRPSMINYDPAQSDSLFLAADTLWLYTIAVLPPVVEKRDTTATAAPDSTAMATPEAKLDAEAVEGSNTEEAMTLSESGKDDEKSSEKRDRERNKNTNNDKGEKGDKGEKRSERQLQGDSEGDSSAHSNDITPSRGEGHTPNTEATDTLKSNDGRDEAADTTAIATPADTLATDSIALDSRDTITTPTAKQLRYRAKMERRRIRDSVRSAERVIRDSLDSIQRRERDSIQYIRDSILQIKIDTIIAKRRTQNIRIAEEEAARIERIKQRATEREHRRIDKAKARAARRGKEYTGPDYTIDTTRRDSIGNDSISPSARDTMALDTMGSDSTRLDSLAMDSLHVEPPFPADSTYKLIKAYRHVRMYRSDIQLVCDSLTVLNTDSIIRLYREPILWNESNQITSDSMAIYTANETISKAHFMGTPILGAEIDTMYYNQVKGKDMTAYFDNGKVYRNDVDGNAQTIYFLQDEGSPDVTGLMYIESAGISFYLDNGEMDKITYKQNPEYVIYPMTMIPETQQRRLDDFVWHDSLRPVRNDVVDRTIRPTRRNDAIEARKPRFRITERIDYDRRRLTENRMWEDRVDELTPDVIEWRDSRPSYKKK